MFSKKTIAFVLVLIVVPTLLWAVRTDTPRGLVDLFALTDTDGHTLQINADGSLPIDGASGGGVYSDTDVIDANLFDAVDTGVRFPDGSVQTTAGGVGDSITVDTGNIGKLRLNGKKAGLDETEGLIEYIDFEGYGPKKLLQGKGLLTPNRLKTSNVITDFINEGNGKKLEINGAPIIIKGVGGQKIEWRDNPKGIEISETTSYRPVLTIDGYVKISGDTIIGVSDADMDTGVVSKSYVDSKADSGNSFSFSIAHTSWSDGLNDEEIFRAQMGAGESLTVQRIEFRGKSGASDTATVDVYDLSDTTVIGNAQRGQTTLSPGSTTDGTTVLIRLSNNTGSAVVGSIYVQGVIE
jgi:hypothetical protein